MARQLRETTLDADLDRACADGRITVDDADEVRRFRDFLTEAGQPGTKRAAEALRKHYPQDWQQALADRQRQVDGEGE